MFKSPSQTIFHQIEKSIKEYRRFAFCNINKKVADLTLDQTLLLISLNENPASSLTKQSELLFKESSSITRMVDSLVQKKYISRTINSTDKRKFDLEVSLKGKETLKSLTPIIESNRKKALNGISAKELNQLNATLNKIIRNCQVAVFLFISFFGIHLSHSQDLNGEVDLIQKVNQIILDNYVFPDVAVKIEQFISKREKEGVYKKIKDPILFSEMLTKDIQSICNDKHLRVLYEPDRIKKQLEVISPEDSLKNVAERENWLRTINYGFQEVKILEGNIGYLDIRRFSNPEVAGTTADAVIHFLKNTDAIIIDVRNNGGGTPKMVQWIISYFFEGEPFLLNTFYKRQGDFTKQFWTIPHSKTKRLPNVKLYVLTSNRTFSAAEEFTYDLKHLNRATIIGEKTGGGAHPGGRMMASSNYNVWIPTSRAINPITKTNWEGQGVLPHIPTSAADAFDMAYLKSLEALREEKDPATYNKIIEKLQQE